MVGNNNIYHKKNPGNPIAITGKLQTKRGVSEAHQMTWFFVFVL